MNVTNLKKRVLFALWAIPLGWWIVNSNYSLLNLLPVSFTSDYLRNIEIFPGHILVIFLVFIALFEYLSMLTRWYKRNGFWLVYIWLSFQVISYFFPENILSMKMDFYILLLFVAFESFIWGKGTKRWKRASLLFSGTFFIAIACISMFDFYADPFQIIFKTKYSNPMLSQLGIITVLAAIFLCDTAAYFIGSLIGKHHFSAISPSKTIEGSVAGLVAAEIVTLIGWHYFSQENYSLAWGAGMGILIGSFAQIGDLLVSLMKRYFKVKDASNIIPGHGGILDRFDSLFFTAPIVNLYVIVVYNIV